MEECEGTACTLQEQVKQRFAKCMRVALVLVHLALTDIYTPPILRFRSSGLFNNAN